MVKVKDEPLKGVWDLACIAYLSDAFPPVKVPNDGEESGFTMLL